MVGLALARVAVDDEVWSLIPPAPVRSPSFVLYGVDWADDPGIDVQVLVAVLAIENGTAMFVGTVAW